MGFIMRNWWKLAVAFIVAGAILFLAGWTMGARGGSVYADKSGLHVVQPDGYTNFTIDEQNLQPFNNVNISAYSPSIEFVPSDHYGLQACLPTAAGAPEWSDANGTLTVNAKSDEFTLNLFGFVNEPTDYVKVYYPASAGFTGLTLETASGDISVPKITVGDFSAASVSGSINAEVEGFTTASVSSSSGDVTFNGSGNSAGLKVKTVSGGIKAGLNGCTQADVSSGSGDITLTGGEGTALTIESSSGYITAQNIKSSALTAQTVSGNVNITGDMRGQTSAKSTSGDVSLAAAGSADQYSYDLTSISGDITVDGQRMGSPARPAAGAPAENTILANTDSGNIRLDFNR